MAFSRFNRCKNKKDFQEFTLVRLGHPVTRINVTQQQLDDRLQDALAFFFDWNFQDSIEEVVQIRKVNVINKNELDLAFNIGNSLEKFEKENGLSEYYYYIDLPESFVGISDVTPIKNKELNNNIESDSSITDKLFDIDWNIENNSMAQMYGNFTGTNYSQNDFGNGLANYDMTRRYISLMKYEFRQTPFYNYNRFTNKLQFMTNPQCNYVLLRGYKIVNPDLYSGIWTNSWLNEYYTALLKIQWGNNLRKLKGITLPGGAQVDAEGLLNEGAESKVRLEEELKNEVANSFPVFRY